MSFQNIAQSTNRGISNARNYLDSRVDSLLRPKTAEGISGFLFDIPDQESIQLQTDVTDHYTEDNSFIQDHIVNKPIEITLAGFVGELFKEAPRGIAGAAQGLQNRLESVEAYLGDYTPGFVQKAQEVIGQAQRAISVVNQTLDRVQNVVGLFSGRGSEETRQQKAFQELMALRAAKTVVTVQTPWVYYDSMVITNIGFVQRGETEEESDISVSLKEFRAAETKTSAYDENLFPPREEIQSGGIEEQGNIRGTEQRSSFLFQARELAGGL